MDSFNIYFEKRTRNPLRKKELEDSGHINNKEWVEQEIEKFTPEEKKELRNLSRRKYTTPEDVSSFKQQLALKRRKELEGEYLKGKKRDALKLVKRYRNVKIYADQYVTNLKESKVHMFRTLWLLFSRYKDILPTRGFDLIITNSETNPDFAKMEHLGDKNSVAAGYYRDNQIFIDEKNVRNVDLLMHEYAHLLADRVSKQVEPILKKEYENMINSYFTELEGRKTRRRNLQGARNKVNRQEVAKRFNFPDPYAATNFDEWFAVLIENWKDMPNNKHTYKFKSILKKVLNRL